MHRIIKWRIIRLLNNILLVLLLLAVIVLVVLPAVFTSSLAVVYTGSMEPFMSVGAIAWMAPVEPTEIAVGDVIAFTQPGTTSNATVSHRVIEVIDTGNLSFQTKGDANEDPDPFTVPAENVIARVPFSVPDIGRFLIQIRKYTRGRLGFGIFIVLPTVMLIGSAIRDVNFNVSPGKRRARQRQKLMERRKKRRAR